MVEPREQKKAEGGGSPPLGSERLLHPEPKYLKGEYVSATERVDVIECD